jgi:uncharacterized protein (TIGR03435 family)
MMFKVLAAQISLAVAFAQAPLQFDVASIKPADPIIAGAGTKVNVGVYIDRNQFRASSMSLRDYLSIGHRLRIYQIEGPDWIATDRFDIQATIPEGEKVTVDGESFSVMMRSLLDERFKIRSHRVPKEFPVYALVQMKDGIKAKESPLDPTDGRSVTAGGAGGPQGTVINLGRGTTLSIGGNRIEAVKFSMLALADTLARFVDRPVVDQTGLTSTYDVALELTQEDFQALMVRSAVAAGVTLPPQAMKVLEIASGDSLHEALARVGLKLEAKKTPLDVLIIDSVSRTPTEN